MALVCRCLAPSTAQARSWHAACAVSQHIEHVVVCLDYRMPVVCCPARATMGGEECDASLAATLADGWHLGLHASQDSRRGRGKRDDSLGVWRRGWRFFPLARGGARASPAGAKAKGFSSTA